MKEITKLGFEQHPTEGSNQKRSQSSIHIQSILKSVSKYDQRENILEKQILIMLLLEYVSTILGIQACSFSYSSCLLLGFANLLLLVLDLFQSEEFLSLKLVKLRDNVCKSPLNLGDDHMLNSIHPAVCGLDDLVQSDERCLQACKLYKQVDCLLIVCLQSLELLSSFGKTSQLI